MQAADLGLAGERALDFGLGVDASGLRGVEALLLLLPLPLPLLFLSSVTTGLSFFSGLLACLKSVRMFFLTLISVSIFFFLCLS